MPLFFFDVADGVVRLDNEGTELQSVHAARIEAVRLLAGMMQDDPSAFLKDDEISITVKDADRLTLCRMEFILSDAPAMKMY